MHNDDDLYPEFFCHNILSFVHKEFVLNLYLVHACSFSPFFLIIELLSDMVPNRLA